MSTPLPQSPGHKLEILLESLWISSQSSISERMSILRLAAQSAAQRQLGQPLQNKALDAAHNLAGTLGTFGLPQGTELARQAEDLLANGETATLLAPALAQAVDRLEHIIASRTALDDIGVAGRKAHNQA